MLNGGPFSHSATLVREKTHLSFRIADRKEFCAPFIPPVVIGTDGADNATSEGPATCWVGSVLELALGCIMTAWAKEVVRSGASSKLFYCRIKAALRDAAATARA